MRNEFVTFCFLFFVQAVRIRQPFLPPAPREIPKGSCIVYVVVHTSGMGNGLLTSFFSFFVQGVRLASPSSLLPAEPFSKGLVLYVCFAHLAQVCEFKYVTDVCVVCRRCVLYQMPRHSRKNAPSLLHDLYLYLLVLLRTSAMSKSFLLTDFTGVLCMCASAND